MKKLIIILLLGLTVFGVNAQNRPYIDDKPIHFGFSLGMNFMDYYTPPSLDTINGNVYTARVGGLTPGFSVGFITDVRLSRHLNLRFTPALHFGVRTVTFRTEQKPDWKHKVDVLSLPISIPLYLKWSAEREVNYRPYLIAGGGVTFDFGRDRERELLQKNFDAFVEVGFGFDLYFSWFKFCPQLTYSIGFLDVLTPVSDRPELAAQDQFYTQSLRRMMNRQLTLTFNFE